MSLKISTTNTPTYDYLSEDGNMTNPATRAVTIDKTGGTKTSSALTLYLVASQGGNSNIGGYSGIKIQAQDADANADGVTWQLSLNGTDWATYIEPSDMDCVGADDVTTIYARISVDNSSGTVAATGNYEAEFEVAATENPPE